VKEMKKELDYFDVDGKYGWDQNDFKDLWMNKGGCACVTACDSFIYMRKYMGKDKLYPYDIDRITSLDYIDFSNSVKPYLRPRITGIDRLEIYVDGVSEFLEDMDEHSISLSEFSGDNSIDDAKSVVKTSLPPNSSTPSLRCLVLNPFCARPSTGISLSTSTKSGSDLGLRVIPNGVPT